MNFLPALPSHPKIRYATILVIGRYAHWTSKHPEFIQSQVQFVTLGFEDSECVGAAALALKYLCEFCGSNLVDFLPQMHSFYGTVLTRLSIHEQKELTEAVCFF